MTTSPADASIKHPGAKPDTRADTGGGLVIGHDAPIDGAKEQVTT